MVILIRPIKFLKGGSWNMFEAASPFSWVEPVTHLGAPGLLVLAVVALWKSRETERKENVQNQQELQKHLIVMEQLVPALDRLRTETLQAIHQGFQGCGIKSGRG